MPLPKVVSDNLIRLDPPATALADEEEGDVVEEQSVPFRLQKQAQTLWCWAAVASAVDRCYAEKPGGSGVFASQCVVASRVLAPADCCDDPDGNNEAVSITEALEQVGHRGGSSVGRTLWDDVRTEIDAGRPLVARIARGDGHFVAVRGYRVLRFSDGSELNELRISDPDDRLTFTSYWLDYDAFPEDGPWSHTDFTI